MISIGNGTIGWMVVIALICGLEMTVKAGNEMDTAAINQWRMFCYVDQTIVESGDYVDDMPEVLAGEGGKLVRPITVKADSRGLIDIEAIMGGFHKKACAMLFAEIEADQAGVMKIGTSADWWMQWRVNGEEVLSTLDFGNNRYYLGDDRNYLLDYVIELPLKKGKNLVSVKVLAGSRKWFFYAGQDPQVLAASVWQHRTIGECMDQPLECIHDERQVPQYELPKVMVCNDGSKVTSIEQWEQVRRGEILELFNQSIYGAIPKTYDNIRYDVAVEDDHAVDGLAIRKQVTITVDNAGKSLAFPLHIFQPKQASGPVPVVLLIYARSPHERWDFRVNSDYWPIRRLVENGFAAASFNRGYLAADDPQRYDQGILSMYPGLTEKADGWRTISAWAYGAMRCIDYLVTDDAIDGEKIAVVGHSRGGKTTLWAAANDPRIALALVNGSGCLGASTSRRKMGEHLPRTNISNPHWFNENYKATADENDLPVDQHMLISLVAPRGICIGGGLGDPEADPKGEYLSLVNADDAFALYGQERLGDWDPPRLEQPLVVGTRSYHIRYGNHDMNEYDWGQYIRMAKSQFGME